MNLKTEKLMENFLNLRILLSGFNHVAHLNWNKKLILQISVLDQISLVIIFTLTFFFFFESLRDSIYNIIFP